MQNELRNQIIVAASAAKAAGFDGTYDALVELLQIMRKSGDTDTSSINHVGITPHLHS